jgi:serine/threonine protein kinase
MTPQRWAEVDRVLDEAMARPPQERAAYLNAACHGDEELRHEVESLLAAHQKAEEKFLKRPAIELAAQRVAVRTGHSLVGQTFSHYSVVSVLGVGGMGEVYLARDTRLARKVALKFLPPQYTRDATRIWRFEREARAASALNHPNIITIYEIGEIAEKHFIVSEYIDGHTLRELLAKGPLAVRDAVEIAIQMAGALAAAHEAGIIHRDIKPENVMLRRDGYVKVLDFGLVKLTERRRSLGETNVSEGDLGKTHPGAVLGTVRYMSPEQALGQDVDQRSDLFSLGVMLYELLTGASPFKGASSADVLDAIVHHPPLPPGRLRAEIPAELDRVLGRLLEKDRELRYQTASDLRAVLKRFKRELDSSPSHSASNSSNGSSGGHRDRAAAVIAARRTPKALPAAAILTLIAAFVVILWWFGWRGPHTEASPWLSAYSTQLTDFPGEERDPNLSPDGKILYFARAVNDNWDLYWQRVDGSKAQPLTPDSPQDDTQPACSPDGNRIVFRSERNGGGLFVMGSTGESVRQLSDFGFHPAWSPGGREIVCGTASIAVPAARTSDSELYVINAETGEKRKLEINGDAARPHWSPTGHRIAYMGRRRQGQSDIWTIPAAGGAPVQVTNDVDADWNPIWSPDGKYMYFVSDRKGGLGLWRVAIDEQSGRALSKPEVVLGPTSQAWQFDIGRDQRRMVYQRRFTRANIQAVEFDPQRFAPAGQPTWITQGSRPSGGPDINADGTLITHHSIGGLQEDIFVIKSDGSGVATNLTNDTARDRTPRWSPDGKQIAFYSNFEGGTQVWVVNADGSGRRKLTNVDRGVAYPFWSPDGKRLGYSIIASQTYLIDLAKSWEQQTPFAVPPVNAEGHWFIGWSWSPDGKRIAGWRGGKVGGEVRDLPGVFLYSLETQTYEQITEKIGRNPVWLKDGRHLLFTDNGTLYLVDAQTKETRVLMPRPHDAITTACISGDNRRIYYTLSAYEADIHLLTLEK